jgi:adenine-specific DNA-methyltransferase
VRYIGNKTRLLPFITDTLTRRGIAPGRALDAFAGTAAVGSHLKRAGFAVVGCDLMTYSYVLQHAYIVADAYPSFAGLGDLVDLDAPAAASDAASDAARPLGSVLAHLQTAVAPRASFITTHYSTDDITRACADAGIDERTAQLSGRMYFTRRNAERIDAIRETLEAWRTTGRVTDQEFYILLAALLEAADSVANTSGVYAAFLKRWQSNARRPLRLTMPALVVASGRDCHAHQGDVNALVARLGAFDLLYLDPPYNNRQYSAYYHVPELLARGWFDGAPALRGKTGLIDATGQRSQWSVRDRCVDALEDLLAHADAAHVVLSYNSEGMIPEPEIVRLFKAYGLRRSFHRQARDYARYRSDADGDQRRYAADRVTEYLYSVRRR